MSHLHLIRLKTAQETAFCYEEKTDVWIFGDVIGYRGFQSAIGKAITSKRIVRPPTIGPKSNSMRWCILPAALSPRHQPRLKFIERVVFFRRVPEMELVIYGNRSGYRWLMECLETMATQCPDNPSDHLHLDDWFDRRIVRRSVSINIRGALSKWSRQGLQQYASLVSDRQPTYLPSDVQHLTGKTFPYETPIPGKPPFVLR